MSELSEINESEEIMRLLEASDDMPFRSLAKIADLDPDTDFRHADLSKLDLSDEDLHGFDLTGANLSEAHLKGANLESVNFMGANLEAADLRGANLSGATLAFANLTDAKLENIRGTDNVVAWHWAHGVPSGIFEQLAQIRISLPVIGLIPEKILPSRGRIIVRPIHSSIGKQRPQEGYVVAVGEGKEIENGRFLPPTVKAGEVVFFGPVAFNKIRLEGENHLIMREDDILGVLNKTEQGWVAEPRPALHHWIHYRSSGSLARYRERISRILSFNAKI